MGQEIYLSFSQFIKGWTAIWFSWLLLYLWLAIAGGLAWYGFAISKSLVWSVADIFNIINAGAFFYVFLVLDVPSVSTEDKPARAARFQVHIRMIWIVCGVVLGFSVLGRWKLMGLETGGPLILSFLVAISMAYFFGRIDSHYLGLRRLMLAPFYLYVAVQVSWPSFAGADVAKAAAYATIIFSYALLAKIYLFLVFSQLLRTDKIPRYMQRATKYYHEESNTTDIEAAR